ncbi:MAG: PfkB family carbohydrate kinase [archaeon]
MVSSNVPAVRKTVLHKIEKLLRDSGWQVQSIDNLDLVSQIGVAVREVPLKSGTADYLLFVKGFPIGLVIAGETEADVLSFSKYSEFLAATPNHEEPLRFVYLCTGTETFFTDLRQPNPPARRIFTVHSPGTLYRWYPELDTRRFNSLELLEYARKYKVRVVADEPEEKHKFTVIELPPKERDLNVRPPSPEEKAQPVNVTVNITNPEKEQAPVVPQVQKKRSKRGKRKNVFIAGPSVYLPSKKIAVRKKPKAVPAKKKKRVRRNPNVLKTLAKKRKSSRRLPVGVFGVFGVDKVRNVSGEEREISAGPGAYSSIGAFFFGRATSVAGSVGKDYSIPEELRGIEKSALRASEERPSAVTLWKHSKSSSAALAPSVRLNAAEERAAPTKIFNRRAKVLFLGNSSPEKQSEFLGLLKARPKFTVLQISSQWLTKRRGLVEAVASKADALLLTEKEARKLSRERNLSKAVEKLSALGPRLVVVKQADHGTMLYSKKDGKFFSPAYPVQKPVDPSGAWEVFGGAFSGYLAAKGRLDFETAKRATIWGEALSSFKKEGYGLFRLSNLARKEAAKRVEEIRKSASV